MADALQRGRDQLRECEAALRRLVSEAASSGDYKTVVSLAHWASELARLGQPLDSQLHAGRAEPAGVKERKRERLSDSHRARVRTPRKQSAEYPRFFRSGDDLVKIGWSKKSHSEYQHRAPRAALESVVTALVEAATAGGVVRIEDVVPRLPNNGQISIPTYQIYVALAWLRVEQLVKQHGRSGYSVPRAADLKEQTERRWQALTRS